jgi:hypothetical protein
LAVRQSAAVRHREPQPEEQSVLAGFLVVLERRAAVVGHVAVEELDVARRQCHLEGQSSDKLHEKIDRRMLTSSGPL